MWKIRAESKQKLPESGSRVLGGTSSSFTYTTILIHRFLIITVPFKSNRSEEGNTATGTLNLCPHSDISQKKKISLTMDLNF